MSERYDVAVIGAGMLGASAAYRLACAGRRVVVVEAAEPASGTTGNSFAWLNAVHKEPEAYHRLNADGVAAYQGLGEELGADIGYHGGGSLQWGETPAEQATIRERVTRLAGRGYAARWISRDEVLALEPGLVIGPEVEGVAYHPNDGWVDAPRLVRAFLNRALAEGADLWRRTPVRALRAGRGGKVTVVTERGELQVDALLVCAGVAAPELLAPLGVRLPVRRVPGLLAVTSSMESRPARVVYAPGVHLRPDVGGGLLLGADDIDALTGEGTSPGEPPEFARPLLERACRVFPAATAARLASVRIGVRPVPEDGHTVAGPVSGLDNVWVLVTHSGITMGPLLGRLIAAEMLGGPPDRRLAPFRPERFAGPVG